MSEWKRVKLGEVSLGIYDGPHATPAPCETPGPYFLGIPQISPLGFIDMASPRYIAERDYSTWTRRVVPQYGDVVFSYEATLNLYALIPRDFRCCLGRRMGLVRPNPKKLDFQFLYYYFYSPEWRGTVRENTITGATVDRLSIAAFPSFKIALPPLAIQRRIAAILSDYDAAIANCRKQIALLEEAALRLYREWFGDGKGEKKTIADVSETIGGGTPSTSKAEYWNGDIPWVIPTDITRNSTLSLLSTEKRISKLGLEKSSAKMLPAKAILMTSRASVGYFGIADFPVCTNQGFISIVPHDEKMRWYLLFNLRTRVEEIRAKAKGATFAEISKSSFRALDVSIPERDKLLSFDNFATGIMASELALGKQIRSLTEARDRLLPKLMSGEVAV